MRLDTALVHQPGEVLGRTIGGVSRQPLRPQAEALLRTVDHPLLRCHLGLANRGGRLNIDDDRVLQVDQVIGAVGEEGEPAIRTCPARAGSAGEINFGTTGVAAPNAASSRTARYSRTAWFAASGARHSLPGTLRCRLASALIMLASTAKPSPPTSPSAMQRRTVVSNTLRNRSLSRKRPCRFFEKVEWSGTEPSSPSRQNQR